MQLGQIYDQQGKPDLALQALTRASRFPAGNTMTHLPVDPKWDPCRTDPRFDELLRRCGFALAATTKAATQ